jgi:DNA segregation ATPase FtsK/SpoIIIE-like protein
VKERRLNEVKGVILVAVGLMIFVSLIRFDRLDLSFYTSHPNFPPKNFLGIFGAYLGGILVVLFGLPASFVLPFLVILLGIKFFRQEPPYLSMPRILGIFILLLSTSSLIGMFNLGNDYIRFNSAGMFGAAAAHFITAYFSRLGGFIIFTTFIILSLALVTEILISSLFLNTLDKTKSFLGLFSLLFKSKKRERQLPLKAKPAVSEKSALNIKKPEPPKPESKMPLPEPGLTSKPKIQIKAKPVIPEPKVKQQELKIGDYQLPSLIYWILLRRLRQEK